MILGEKHEQGIVPRLQLSRGGNAGRGCHLRDGGGYDKREKSNDLSCDDRRTNIPITGKEIDPKIRAPT